MENELKKYKIATYCRKSQDAEDKQVLSIPAQKEEAQNLALRYGLTDVVSYEESKSAKAPNQRPKFTKMKEDLKSGKINAILCWKLDRLARNMDEGGEIIDLLQRGIIRAIITPQKIYWPNENALLMAVEFGSANQFSRDLSVNVKRGQRQKAQKGVPHGLAALGFKNDRTEEKGNRKWLIDEMRLPLVKELFDLFLTGTWSSGRLAKYARETLKFTTPKHKKIGGALVTASRIHAMLRDPIYAHFFFYGGERWELDNNLPSLIIEIQHERILRILSGKNIPKVKSHVLTYTGFVTSPSNEFIGQDVKSQLICDCKHKFSYINKDSCPKCDRSIINLEKPKYLEYRYYYNVPRRKQGLEVSTVEENKLQDYLINYFNENLQLSPALAEWSKKYLYELRDNDVEKNRALVSQEKGKVEEAKKRKQKIIQLMSDDQMSGEDGKTTLAQLNRIIESKDTQPTTDWFDTAMDITNLTQEFSDIMSSDDIEAKRRILGRLGSNLVWDEEKVSIINTKWMNVLIDGLRAAKKQNPQFEPRNIVDTSSSNEVFASVHPIMLRG